MVISMWHYHFAVFFSKKRLLPTNILTAKIECLFRISIINSFQLKLIVTFVHILLIDQFETTADSKQVGNFSNDNMYSNVNNPHSYIVSYVQHGQTSFNE